MVLMAATKPKLFRPNPTVRREFEAFCKRLRLNERETLEALMLHATEIGEEAVSRLRAHLAQWLNERAGDESENERVKAVTQKVLSRPRAPRSRRLHR